MCLCVECLCRPLDTNLYSYPIGAPEYGGAGNEWKATLLQEFEAPVWRVSWSLTAQMLAVSSGDNDVSLWRAGLDGVWSQMGSVPDASVEPPNQQ